MIKRLAWILVRRYRILRKRLALWRNRAGIAAARREAERRDVPVRDEEE